MRLLIFSDTHGQTEPMLRAVRAEGPDALFHLGDCVPDAEALGRAFPRLPLYSVRGNCDPFSQAPELLTPEVAGLKVFACHGHRYNVKMNTEALLNAGWLSGAKLVLFGHTHMPLLREFPELTLLNPGSGRGSCGLVLIENGVLLRASLLQI